MSHSNASTRQSTEDHPSERLQRRLSAAGARAAELVDDFPESISGQHVADQLLRAATAPGAHYAEARGAQSRSDFIHKLSLATKEIRETEHWVRIASEGELIDSEPTDLLGEISELIAILSSALQTARENEKESEKSD